MLIYSFRNHSVISRVCHVPYFILRFRLCISYYLKTDIGVLQLTACGLALLPRVTALRTTRRPEPAGRHCIPSIGPRDRHFLRESLVRIDLQPIIHWQSCAHYLFRRFLFQVGGPYAAWLRCQRGEKKTSDKQCTSRKAKVKIGYCMAGDMFRAVIITVGWYIKDFKRTFDRAL